MVDPVMDSPHRELITGLRIDLDLARMTLQKTGRWRLLRRWALRRQIAYLTRLRY